MEEIKPTRFFFSDPKLSEPEKIRLIGEGNRWLDRMKIDREAGSMQEVWNRKMEDGTVFKMDISGDIDNVKVTTLAKGVKKKEEKEEERKEEKKEEYMRVEIVPVLEMAYRGEIVDVMRGFLFWPEFTSFKILFPSTRDNQSAWSYWPWSDALYPGPNIDRIKERKADSVYEDLERVDIRNCFWDQSLSVSGSSITEETIGEEGPTYSRWDLHTGELLDFAPPEYPLISIITGSELITGNPYQGTWGYWSGWPINKIRTQSIPTALYEGWEESSPELRRWPWGDVAVSETIDLFIWDSYWYRTSEVIPTGHLIQNIFGNICEDGFHAYIFGIYLPNHVKRDIRGDGLILGLVETNPTPSTDWYISVNGKDYFIKTTPYLYYGRAVNVGIYKLGKDFDAKIVVYGFETYSLSEDWRTRENWEIRYGMIDEKGVHSSSTIYPVNVPLPGNYLRHTLEENFDREGIPLYGFGSLRVGKITTTTEEEVLL